MTRKKGMPIPWDWDNTSWKCWAVQWPDSPLWQAILWGFITTPSRGRFWDESTGDLISVLTIGKDINERNEPLEECLMSCNDEMQAIFEEISASLAALAAKNCCQTTAGGGTGGAGLESEPPNPFELDPELGDPPAGFASWEEYDTYACDMAHYILDQMIGDIATTFVVGAGVTSAGVLGTALLGALFTPIGWAAIAAIAALFFTLLIAGINAATLTGLLEDNRDELVCSMLNGADVVSKLADFGDAVEAAVAADGTISALGSIAVGLASDFIKSYATTDSFNRLIEQVPYPIPTGNDCSGCGPADLWTDGTLPNDAEVIAGSYSGPTITLESAVNDIGGFNVQSLDLFSIPTDVDQRLRLTDVVAAGSGDWKYRYSVGGVDQGETTGSNWATLETFDEECSYFILFSTDAGPGTPFTVTFNLTP